MYSNYLSRFYVPLILAGFLASACSPPASTETKAAPEAKPAVMPAPVESAPAPAPEPAEKPRRGDERRDERKKAPAVASLPPQVVAPQPVPAPAAAPEPQSVPVPPAPVVTAQPTPPPPPPVIETKDVALPAGTAITILMIDSVDSATAHVGDTFRASIDSAVMVDNDVVLQRGADAVVRLTDVSSAGKIKGKSELQLVLDRVSVGKKTYTVDTNVYEQEGAEQGKKTARNGALGAALGAAIGAIAGGGKGAVIGAGAGAGGGVGATAVMKGDQVQVPSETRVMFTLKQPVNVTITPGAPSSVTRQTAAPQRDRFSTSPQQTQPEDRPRVRRRQPLQ